MLRWWSRWGCWVVFSFALAVAGPAAGQRTTEADRLNAEVHRLFQAGRYADAIPIAQRLLGVLEKSLGLEHPDVASALNDLANLYRAQGLASEAEPLYRRALVIGEKTLGSDHPFISQVLVGIAALHQSRGSLDDARKSYQRALEIRKSGGHDNGIEAAEILDALGHIYWLQGHNSQAESTYTASLRIRETKLGEGHESSVEALQKLAILYTMQARYSEAESLYRRALEIRQRAGDPSSAEVGDVLIGLASLYTSQGRYGEAEATYKRALTIQESVNGLDSEKVGSTLQSLISLYEEQGRGDEAQPLRGRVAEINQKALMSKQATPPDELAALVAELQKGDGDVEALIRRAIVLLEEKAPENIFMGQFVRSLALLYNSQGRYTEAVPLFLRALELQEKAIGPESNAVAAILLNLGWSYSGNGDLDKAQAAFARALKIWEQTLSPDHPQLSQVLSELAGLSSARGDWSRAAEYWRRSTRMIERRALRGLADQRGDPSQAEAERASRQFKGLVKALYRLAPAQSDSSAASVREAFQSAQWAQSPNAAESLAQMAARGATNNADLATIVRERQDLVNEWLAKDRQLAAARSDAPAQRNVESEKVASARLVTIDVLLAQIDGRLAREFPSYGALARPQIASLDDVRALLTDNEALVLFLDTDELTPSPEETFVWVVTKTESHWLRSDLGTSALQREVTALRCGLDATAWNGDGAERCADLLRLPLDKAPRSGDSLPFDTARAHALYKSLLGDAEHLIKSKHLLVVPSGALTTLPFQVLVTEPPKSKELAAARWLIRDHPLSVLPSVASLTALRRTAKPSAALKPIMGFANPLLDGDQTHPQNGDYFRQQAQLARDHAGCATTAQKHSAARRMVARSPATVPDATQIADLDHLRKQSPLPETADELCEVARTVGGDVEEMRIGVRATETEVKRLSSSGELVKYRMLHFATHGTLAGQISGTSEPGLILTPPARASADDDGFLSGSEIAALKLDADWVILSACNTAGGAGQGEATEALSGLAQVFFYAGARALLVSHWEVDSNAAVKLVTRAIDAIAKDTSVGRADALQRAMLAVMADTSRPADWVPAAHPAVWAPFVVVGEGGSGR